MHAFRICLVFMLSAPLSAQGWTTLRQLLPPSLACGDPSATSVGFPFLFVSAVGDLDGDHVGDYVVRPLSVSQCPTGALWKPYRTVYAPYGAAAHSGATGARLWTSLIGLPFSIGVNTSGAGDIDGDGRDDVMLANAGIVTLARGTDASAIRQHTTVARVDSQTLAALGDLNGDGRSDYAAVSEIGSPTQSIVTVYSGLDGTTLRTHPGGIVQAAGDFDRDGIGDVIVGYSNDSTAATGSISIYSGATGIVVLRVVGALDESLGSSVASGFDFDGDLTPDFCATVGLPRGAVIERFSGADGTRLGAFETMGIDDDISLVFAGDVDGDGHADLLASGFASTSGPIAETMSGRTGEVIWSTSLGTDGLPSGRLASLGDTDGDGRADIVVLRYVADLLGFRPDPSIAAWSRLGVGCVGSTGDAPSIGAIGMAELGEASQIVVRRALHNTSATLLFGDPTVVDLGIIGLPSCTLYSQPFLATRFLTSSRGDASQRFQWTTNVAPIGATFDLQWAVLDPAANPLGVSLSDALRVRIGL